MRIVRIVFVALLALCLSCEDSGLGGSLSEAFDLSFSSIKIRQSPKAIQVSYLRSEGRETTIALTFSTEGLDLGENTFDLTGEWAPGHPRCTVSRAVDSEPVRSLPTISDGEISFSDAPSPGKDVSGTFSLSFSQGGDVGAGRTLKGAFRGIIEAIE